MISCTEFIYSYSELFKFIEKKGGKDAIRKMCIRDSLVTVMWANEQFDPAHPDTYSENVEENK